MLYTILKCCSMYTLLSVLLNFSCKIDWLDQLDKGDTLQINYRIAYSEFGGVHEGIFLYKDRDQIRVKHVIYNYGISYVNGMVKADPESKLAPLVTDSVSSFFHSINEDFRVKKELILNKEQIYYLKGFFEEAEEFQASGFSNAPEYYAIFGKDQELVVLDPLGQWDKHKEIKKMLNLQ